MQAFLAKPHKSFYIIFFSSTIPALTQYQRLQFFEAWAFSSTLFTVTIHSYCSQALFIGTVYRHYSSVLFIGTIHLRLCSIGVVCLILSYFVLCFLTSISFGERFHVDVSSTQLPLERDFVLTFPHCYYLWREFYVDISSSVLPLEGEVQF